jgi:DNA-binding beta-propeller fold protein YncE
MRGARVRAAWLGPLLMSLLVAGCGAGADPLRVARGSPAAPAVAPVPSVSPRGQVFPAGVGAAAVVVLAAGDRVAVGVSDAVLVQRVDAPPGTPVERVPAPGPVRALLALPGGGFRALAGDQLLTWVDGELSGWALPGTGSAMAALADGGVAVTLPERGQVLLLGPDGAVRHTIDTGGRPSSVAAVAGGQRIGVVDPESSVLSVFRVDTGAREEALRAGDGATTVAADARGRLLVADTRDHELLVFATGPLALRQRHPVPGAPYAMAFDPRGARLWVTLTARNEVVGFDLGGGSPREVHRWPTVRQPDAVAVGPTGGTDGATVAVLGRVEGLVQVSRS